jgi:hypothetical protein
VEDSCDHRSPDHPRGALADISGALVRLLQCEGSLSRNAFFGKRERVAKALEE